MKMTILDKLDEATLLEQLAEECAELAKAALKLARKKRGENPTPKTEEECVEEFIEECADVDLCKSVLMGTDWWDEDKFNSTWFAKWRRWQERMEENDR